MISALFRVMVLGLWRDRGAMLLTFALPSLVFAIFASIFSGATEGELHLRVGIAVYTEDEVLLNFAESLPTVPELNATLLPNISKEQLEQRVRRGDFDTGLVVQSASTADSALFTILMEPSRRIAAVTLEGILRQHLAEQAPHILARRQIEHTEVLIGGFTTEQQAVAKRQLQPIDDAKLSSVQPSVQQMPPAPPLVTFRSVHQATPPSITGRSGIAYYAGATAMLFLLLSAANAAMVSIEERQSGIEERLLLGPCARLYMLLGRFLFLVCLGSVQAAVIFGVARFGFGLPVQDAWLEIAAIILACAAASAGIALLVLSLCKTTQQAATFSSFFVLILSAVGGSMIPRFMMPEWLQTLSWFTPNAWAIEGFYNAIMRDDSWSTTGQAFAVLVGIGLSCLALSGIPMRNRL